MEDYDDLFSKHEPDELIRKLDGDILWRYEPMDPHDKRPPMVSDAPFRAAKRLRSVGWQPIETAPKDGTEILGYRWYEKLEGDNYEFYNVVYWEKGLGWCLNGGDCIKFHVTHWMPLPLPLNVSRETQEWD